MWQVGFAALPKRTRSWSTKVPLASLRIAVCRWKKYLPLRLKGRSNLYNFIESTGSKCHQLSHKVHPRELILYDSAIVFFLLRKLKIAPSEIGGMINQKLPNLKTILIQSKSQLFQFTHVSADARKQCKNGDTVFLIQLSRFLSSCLSHQSRTRNKNHLRSLTCSSLNKKFCPSSGIAIITQQN